MTTHSPTRLLLIAVFLLATAVSCTPEEDGRTNNNSSAGGKTTSPQPQFPAFGRSPSGEVVDTGPPPIEPTGAPVTGDTVLQAGDKVQVLWTGTLTLPDGKTTNESWWSGEVLACNQDDTVKIHYIGWRSEWDESVSRDRLRKEKQ